MFLARAVSIILKHECWDPNCLIQGINRGLLSLQLGHVGLGNSVRFDLSVGPLLHPVLARLCGVSDCLLGWGAGCLVAFSLLGVLHVVVELSSATTDLLQRAQLTSRHCHRCSIPVHVRASNSLIYHRFYRHFYLLVLT